jgi:hypothetical protein
MKRQFSKVMLLGALLVATSGFALAQAPQQSVADILKTQHDIRDRMDTHYGEYSRFDDASLVRMKRAQDKVFAMLDGVQSLDQLNDFQKTNLSNALDEIKAVLTANEGNRLICYRERKTGSNMIERRCETAAQREARARDSQEQLREYAPTAQERHGG